ncbi:hypothetical protein HH214_15145 [Mucilaginibacter robiniae]|uniref:Uncharacterized protein n=1 Tax=Mucilaginibacter robiniae TaxID=2728022 RepID=A0A7L5E3D8_9SPHI|nr:hypothetical protein [Mucilaginibacter robiniae]QJD97108.1 hypothetical protein HH214_15145 [Mucilaginibacter robiniae]
MKKRFCINTLTLLLSISSLTVAQAQDSVHVKPKTTTTPAKPAFNKPGIVRPGAAKPITPGAYQPAAAHPGTATPTYRTQPATRPNPYAQQVPAAGAPVNTDKSLSGQYQYLSTKVYGYQRPQLAAFYKNIMDTIRAERQKLRTAQSKLATQGKAVQDLQSDVSEKEQSLNESNSKRDAISLAGILVSKGTYNLIMWGLVILFGAVAAVVIAQSGSARREAKYRIKLYDELDEEYKGYKIKANEKEKKMARELQTVRNKLEEITGNPGY